MERNGTGWHALNMQALYRYPGEGGQLLQKRGPAVRRPSPSIVISVIALVFSMSGTAYAATGGTFLLGRANTEGSVASLSNTHGTALSLSSAKGKPPLTVNRTVQIPRLNASELQGISASGSFTAPAAPCPSGLPSPGRR